MAKIFARIALLLLAAGLVTAAAAVTTRPFDPKQNELSILQRAVKRPATAESEATLRRVIGEIQQGRPDYARMNPKLAEAVRRQLPQQQKFLTGLGPPKSLTYLGGIARMDFYRAAFADGALLWGIAVGADGSVQSLLLVPPGPPSPQDWKDNYARFELPERATRLAGQLGILLAAALFGRLALRLRL